MRVLNIHNAKLNAKCELYGSHLVEFNAYQFVRLPIIPDLESNAMDKNSVMVPRA